MKITMRISLNSSRITTAQTDRIGRLMDQSDSAKLFVSEGVVKSKGEDITAADLLVGYYEFCETKGWHPLPSNELRSQLVKHMLEIHKSNSRHDIKRGEKSARCLSMLISRNPQFLQPRRFDELATTKRASGLVIFWRGAIRSAFIGLVPVLVIVGTLNYLANGWNQFG